MASLPLFKYTKKEGRERERERPYLASLHQSLMNTLLDSHCLLEESIELILIRRVDNQGPLLLPLPVQSQLLALLNHLRECADPQLVSRVTLHAFQAHTPLLILHTSYVSLRIHAQLLHDSHLEDVHQLLSREEAMTAGLPDVVTGEHSGVIPLHHLLEFLILCASLLMWGKNDSSQSLLLLIHTPPDYTAYALIALLSQLWLGGGGVHLEREGDSQ